MRSIFILTAALTVALTATLVTAQTAIRCEVDGKVVYGDTACAPGSTARRPARLRTIKFAKIRLRLISVWTTASSATPPGRSWWTPAPRTRNRTRRKSPNEKALKLKSQRSRARNWPRKRPRRTTDRIVLRLEPRTYWCVRCPSDLVYALR